MVNPIASVPGQTIPRVGFLSPGFAITRLLLLWRTGDRMVNSSRSAWSITGHSGETFTGARNEDQLSRGQSLSVDFVSFSTVI